ncbi:MAG: InlB B-repeat-containing protein, partial [Clostridiaceae bacterium]
WTANTYTMTFDAEGGSTVGAVTQNYNTQVAKPGDPTRTGYTFGGWYEGDNGAGNAVSFPYTLTADKTVYAKWIINTYTVTYKNNYDDTDTTIYTSQSVIGIKKLTAPEQPTRTGYIFGGWYTNNTCTDAWNFKNNTVAAGIVLYAKWTAAPVLKYAITYAPYGATSGSVPVDSNAYTAGSTARVSANTGSLAKAGYTFNGWSDSGTTYTAGQIITISGDVTLNAVWTAVLATYTVIYSNNYAGGGTYTTQSDVSSGSTLTAPSEPSRIGYSFIGWYKDAACINLWNFNFDTVKADTILYAKWAANTYTVSGTVVDDGTPSAAVRDATVKVMQGNVQFGNPATTDDSGNFTVTGVPDGIYNIVAAKGDQIVTICITVNGGDYTYTGTVTLPSGYKNSTLDIIGSETPNVVVDGLNNLFNDSTTNTDDSKGYTQEDKQTVDNGGTVEIKLTVQKNDQSTNKATVEAAMSSNGYTSGTVLDIDMTKTTTTSNGASDNSQITATSSLIKIIIPLPAELQGKDSYVVYRAHDYGGGVVTEAITTTANANGEYIEVSSDKTQITAYLKYFSTYAIAYNNASQSDSDSGSGSSSTQTYEIISTAGAGGCISPSGSVSVTAGQNKTFTITADNGYLISHVLVDGTSIGAVSGYTFSNIGAAHTIKAVFTENAGLPYYVDDNGTDVFIGFASDAGGTMKYIAPKGKAVQFIENPKNFMDISGHWAKSYIDFVTEREIFLGTGSNTFSPDTGMTRAMFATVIGRLYERSYGKITATDAGNKFTDADYNAYYGNYVEWAAENSIIAGVGGGKFEPDRMITREEMAVILHRFAEFLNTSAIESGAPQLSYPDASAISSWAADAARYCQQTAIISGRDGGNFVPKGTATRAEVAVILQRFVDNTVK